MLHCVQEQEAKVADIDIKTFWQTLGQRPIGATIVTARGKAGPAGFLGLSASHISADPPTMLVSVGKKTSALQDILESRHFAVNFLAAGAETLVEMFGGRTDDKGASRFDPEKWTTLETGAPVYRDAQGAMDCRLEDTIERGDVVIAIGRVVAVSNRGEGEPLVLFRGKPRRLSAV
jgi:flavin reductase